MTDHDMSLRVKTVDGVLVIQFLDTRNGTTYINRELCESYLTREALPLTVVHLSFKTWWDYQLGIEFVAMAKKHFWDC